MVPHAGTRTRTWREVVGLGAELARCDELLGSRVAADVAVLFDWHNLWAMESRTKPSNTLAVMDGVRAVHRALFDANRTVDFAHPEADLSAYRVVIAPTLYLTSEETGNNLRRFVEGGGILVLTFFSGIVDVNDHVRLGGYPAQWRALLGLTVDEVAPQPEARVRDVATEDGERFGSRLWSDLITLEGATAIASYADDAYPGGPAVTEHAFGRGLALYLGTQLDPVGMRWMVRRAAALARLPDEAGLPAGVEVVRRSREGATWTIVLNYSGSSVEISVDRPSVDLLTGAAWSTAVAVGPRDAVVLRAEG